MLHNDAVSEPPPEPVSGKAELRLRLLAARRARTRDAIETARAAVAAHVLAEAGRRRWGRVAAYVPLRTEPGSTALLDGLRTAGADVLVPITRPDRDLDWARWPDAQSAPDVTPGEAREHGLGLDAVGSVDAVLVPALAVARDGSRLGRGGGSYDRALARITPGTPVLALVYADEVLDRVPTDPWDRPVDAAVTPAGITWFGNRE